MPRRTSPVARIVSGGQSGADRAAVDAAIELGVAYGGWVPKGGWAEDLPDPPGVLAAYGRFREAPTDDPADRTRRNVMDSDATLLMAPALEGSPGCQLTWRLAAEANRPRLLIDPFSTGAAVVLSRWASDLLDGCVLNVAGPRTSECPGIHDAVRALLMGCADELFGAEPTRI